MVNIGKQNDINKDLGDYISKKRGVRRSIIPGVSFKIKKKKIETYDDISKEEIERSMKEKPKKQEIADDYAELEELDHEELEIERKKESILRRIINVIMPPKEEFEDYTYEVDDADVEEVEIEQEVIDEDVKDVLKISFEWIKQLPAEKLRKIKKSAEFERYKEVLTKYGLAKKK